MNSQILERVVASGICGIKKAELRKMFGKECDASLDALAKDEKIIVDSKGVAHYVWSRENYMSHISENDPKFKIVSKLVKNLENSINQLKAESATMPAAKTAHSTSDFQTHFDQEITNLSTSIGWVPFSDLRHAICDMLQITSEQFYSMSLGLVESNPAKYEISTGGQEGIRVRGMLHGYVRRL